MKKRLIIRILCLTLCMALLVTGCGSKQEDNQKNETTATEVPITKAPITEEAGGRDENSEPVKDTPEPSVTEPEKTSYFESVAENVERMVKEALEQYNSGDYTPLSAPVKYNVLWLGYTPVTYGELDFQMTAEPGAHTLMGTAYGRIRTAAPQNK